MLISAAGLAHEWDNMGVFSLREKDRLTVGHLQFFVSSRIAANDSQQHQIKISATPTNNHNDSSRNQKELA